MYAGFCNADGDFVAARRVNKASESPIRSWFGMVMMVIAFLFIVFIIVRCLVFGDLVAG